MKVWCGMIWYGSMVTGMVWYDLVMVWYDLVMVWYDLVMVWYSVVWYALNRQDMQW
jgi:hypothetical protein